MAAVTNEMIITSYMIENGITEEIHTFQKWRDLGYTVKRGEHSEIKISIWKAAQRQQRTTDGEQFTETKLFLKTAAFFKFSQVEKLNNKEVL